MHQMTSGYVDAVRQYIDLQDTRDSKSNDVLLNLIIDLQEFVTNKHTNSQRFRLNLRGPVAQVSASLIICFM